MRRILIDSARRKNRQRHGGEHQRVDLDSQLDSSEQPDDLLAFDEALERLARRSGSCRSCQTPLFAGLTIEEAAPALDISVRTANRHWAFARAWLYQQLS